MGYLENIFSDSQWNAMELMIQEIMQQSDLLEEITKGRDYLETSKFSLQLHTFISRQNGISTIRDSYYTTLLTNIILHSTLIEKLSALFDRKLNIFRMQLNAMTQG